MFDFKDNAFCKPSHNFGEYPPEKPRYTMTEEVEHTARQMRETIDRLLKFEERVTNDVNSMMSSVTSDNVIFKSTMRDSWTTFLEEVKREINSFESNVDSTVALFQKSVESNYAGLDESTKLQINGFVDSLNERFEALETGYETELSTFMQSMQEQYNSLSEAVNGRVDANNNTFEQSFADYQRKLITEINMFQSTVNTQITNHIKAVNDSIELFKNTWTQVIEERLNTQDAKISDAELYMKTNLEATVTTLIGDMRDTGELNEIIEGELFNDLEYKVERIISPEFYGAFGDGETDDTEALKQCLTSGSFILLKGKYLITEPLDFTGLNNIVLYGGEIVREENETFNTISGENCSNIHVINVTFDGKGNDRSTAYEWKNNAQACIILAGNASNIFIEKCIIKNYNYGIYILGAELDSEIDCVNGTIKDCVFRNCHSAIDTHGKNTVIVHNSFFNITENAIQIESEGTPTEDNPLNDSAYYYSAVGTRVSDNIIIDVANNAIIIHDNAYGVKVDNNTIIDFGFAINANRDFRGCHIVNNTIIHQKDKTVSADVRPWDLSLFAIYCGKNSHIAGNYLKGCYTAIIGREGSTIENNKIVKPKVSAIAVSSSDATLIHFINNNVITDFVKNESAWWGSHPIVLNGGLAILTNNLVYADCEPVFSNNAKAKIVNLFSTVAQSTAITPITVNVYSN